MKIRILIVEDDVNDATLVVESLRDYGFDPEWERVESLDDLDASLSQRQWDAVLCDYNMPKVTAEDAVRIVRERDANLPFILVSGTVDASVAVQMMRQGMHEYVMKDELQRLGPALEREMRDAAHRRSERIAKAELFELQNRFRNTFEQSSVGIAHLDRQSRVIWSNRQLAELLGYDPEEIIGIACERLTWHEDWPQEQARQQSLVAGEMREYRTEKRYRRRDGTPIWTFLTLTAIRDEDGELSYLSAVVQDITDQKAAEERVQASELFTRAVLDSLPFQVAVVDQSGVIRHVNSAWEEFALENGLDSVTDVGVGTSYLSVCPDDVRDKLIEVINGARSSFSIEYPCHSPKERRWFLMQVAPLTWGDRGAVISHVDISSRVLTEQALERREREYRSIIETMGEGLMSLDREGRLLFANRRFIEMVGYELVELRGRNMVDFFIAPAERDEIREQIAITLAGRPTGFQAAIHHKDGREIWIEVSTTPRFDSEGTVVGRLSVVSDITEKRAAEQEQNRLRTQIEELNRIESLGKLAGTMAHEFNNVLMGIQPFTEVIRRSAPGNEKVDQATQFIGDAVQRGRRVSQEILRFARPTPLERTELEVNTLLEHIERAGRGIVNGTHELMIESFVESATICADREQLLQIFTNLILNATAAMEPRGLIRIRARRDDPSSRYEFGVIDHPERYLHLEVSDTGCGMPSDVTQKVFEPMFTTKRTGTGLGLAIVHQIVTAHNGYVFVESEVGEGTTFHLFLPFNEGAVPDERGELIRAGEGME